ncbi:MAG: hypothetical protein IT435_05655 [Phycisphaerales bacterium]|nr:hypothetical protein [Phycisphaerales bacterium]
MSLLGTFHFFFTNNYPLAMYPFVIYIITTGGRGDFAFKIEMMRASGEGAPLFSKSLPMKVDDPQQFQFHVASVPGLVIPEPGEYVLNLWADDHLLSTRRMPAHKVG